MKDCKKLHFCDADLTGLCFLILTDIYSLLNILISFPIFFQDCLRWFLHYESHSVGERILSCHPFWHFGCYPGYVVWNFSPANLCWCLFWLQREGRALWIQFWNIPVFCSWAIESLSIQEPVGLKHLWPYDCKMMFRFVMILKPSICL